jgi:DNA-binding NarL/FixJ family response regulator
MLYSKLLICDDQPAIRAAVRNIAMHCSKDIEIVEAGTAVEALGLFERYSDIDLVLLDLHMPGMSGLDLLSTLKLRFPSLPIVVLSSDETRVTVLDALERGASGYVCKSSPTDLLMKLLQHAILGGIALPITILDKPKTETANSFDIPRYTSQVATEVRLSARQMDVLACLLNGMSNKQIGRKLGLSEGTIKTHIKAIFRALGVNSRAQVVIEASRRGFRVGGRRC